MNDIIRLHKGKLITNTGSIELQRKGLVFLLVDVSASMREFVDQAQAQKLPGSETYTADGKQRRYIDNDLVKKNNLVTKIEAVIAGASIFADKALKTKMVGIILFGSNARLYCKATHDRDKLQQAIAAIDYDQLSGGSTNLAAALALLTDERCPAVETVVVVTDGKPDSAVDALYHRRELMRRGTAIMTIGTEDADWDFLGKLRTQSDLSVRTTDMNLTQAITDAGRLLGL